MPMPKIKIAPAKKQRKLERRPSFDIAREFVELNLAAVPVGPEPTRKEAKKAEKQNKKLERQEAKKRHRVRNFILYGLALIGLCVAVVSVWWFTSLQPVNAQNTATRQFVVDKGASTDQIASALQKAGFIRNSLAYKIYARLNNKFVEAGTHMLSPSYSTPEIAEKLMAATINEVDIQVPPGLTLKQLRDIWKKYGYSDADIDQAYAANYDNSILSDRPAGASLEGYIYPETYRIYSGEKLQVVIEKSLAELEKVAAANDLKAKFAARGFDFHQGVTLASIIIKEVPGSSDQKIIADIFYRRLKSNISLGSDPTFKYAYAQGLCDVSGPQCDSAYNTRVHYGLPPGPISNVNFSSLDAAANPTATDYYYFVNGDGDDAGKIFFARTLEEHYVNTAAHCRILCK